MQTLPTFKNEDIQAISQLHGSLKSGQTITLSPDNKSHAQVLKAALDASGKTNDRYPQLHNVLTNGNWSDGKERANDVRFVDGGADKNGKAAATVWYATKNEPLHSGGALIALDHNNQLVGFGSNSDVCDGFLPVSIDSPSAKKLNEGNSLKLLSLHHVVSHDGTTQFIASADTRRVLAASDVLSVVVNDPQPINHPGAAQVNIAVGRQAGAGNQDVDYAYTEPQNIAPNPYLIVPFTGNATAVPFIITGTPGQPISGANFSTYILFNSASGAAFVTPVPANTFSTGHPVSLNNQVIMSGPNSLNWSFPFDPNNTSYQNTPSIVYKPEPLVNDKTSYFLFGFSIPVNDPSSPFSFTVCSDDTPNEPSIHCFKVRNIMFTWHCIAEGAQITMENDRIEPIEALNNTHRVKIDANGKSLAVEATTRGNHSSKKEQLGSNGVYKLITSCGKELIATGAHAISTPQGLVMLCDITTTHKVKVIEGTSAVISCDPIDFKGEFFNLKLGNEADRTVGYDKVACTFFANGILVGDHNAMTHQMEVRRRDISYMRTRIGSNFTKDYESAVKDINY